MNKGSHTCICNRGSNTLVNFCRHKLKTSQRQILKVKKTSKLCILSGAACKPWAWTMNNWTIVTTAHKCKHAEINVVVNVTEVPFVQALNEVRTRHARTINCNGRRQNIYLLSQCFIETKISLKHTVAYEITMCIKASLRHMMSFSSVYVW
jgi:hypothetical protein